MSGLDSDPTLNLARESVGSTAWFVGCTPGSAKWFIRYWRQELINQAWNSLDKIEKQTGDPYATLLRRPGVPFAQLAEQLSAERGSPFTVVGLRQLAYQARKMFGGFLVDEVVRSLRSSPDEVIDADRLEQDLIGLGLLSSNCQVALQQYRSTYANSGLDAEPTANPARDTPGYADEQTVVVGYESFGNRTEDILEWHDGAFCFEGREQFRPINAVKRPAPEAWRCFWETLDTLRVWEWSAHFSNSDLSIRDDHCWRVTLTRGDRRHTSRGSNAYPPGFQLFLTALDRLTGTRFSRLYGDDFLSEGEWQCALDAFRSTMQSPATSVPALVHALGDPSFSVRDAAAGALEFLGMDAVPVLLAAVTAQSGEWAPIVAREAREILARLGCLFPDLSEVLADAGPELLGCADEQPIILNYENIGLPSFDRTGDVLQWHDGAFRFQGLVNRRPIHAVNRPTPEAWRRFWETVDTLRVWEWRVSYSNPRVYDGHCWKLTLAQGDRLLSSGGSNSYPPGFHLFLRALDQLARSRFHRKNDFSEDEWQRALEAFQSIRRPPATAVSMLVQALGDSSFLVRYAAAGALGFLGVDAVTAAPALLAAAAAESDEHDWAPTVATQAQETLARLALGPTRLLPAIFEILDSCPALDLHPYWLDQLLDTREDRPALLSGLTAGLRNDSQNVRLWCLAALQTWGSESEATVPAVLQCLSESRGECQQAAVRALLELRSRSPEIVPALTEQLLNSFAASGVPDLILILLEFSQGQDLLLAGRAAGALAELGPRAEAARSALMAAIRLPSADVRAKAAQALSQVGAGPEVLAPLADLALGEFQSGRRAAFEDLWLLAPQHFPVLILEGLRRRPDTKMADGLALELVNSLHGGAVPVLLEALADAEPASRRWAIHCLRKIGREAAPAIPVLQRLRDNDSQTLIRQEAARALVAIEAQII